MQLNANASPILHRCVCALVAACFVLVTSCHTTKQADITAKADSSAIAVSSADMQHHAAASRSDYTSIALDSFEFLLLPPSLALNDDSFCSAACTARSNNAQPVPDAGPLLLLRAKHATLSKGVLSSEQLSLITAQHDSLQVSHSSQYRRQVSKISTAVAKPPNLTWLIASCTALALAALFIYCKWLKR